MRRAVEHGGEAEELAGRRLVDDHFLLIFVHGGDAHPAGDHDVGVPARVAGFIDALAKREMLLFDLRGENREFIVIQKRKQGNVAQDLNVAWHAN